jgi:phosphoglycolate phosphatase-like HAD superfamily hydrolase
MMIRNLLWHLDGTLFNTEPALIRAATDALQTAGVQYPPPH